MYVNFERISISLEEENFKSWGFESLFLTGWQMLLTIDLFINFHIFTNGSFGAQQV